MKCLFLGHKHGVKSDILFDLHNKKLSLLRETVFFENIFPYPDFASTPHIMPPYINKHIPQDYSLEYLHNIRHSNIPITTPQPTTTTMHSPIQTPNLSDIITNIPHQFDIITNTSTQPPHPTRKFNRITKSPTYLQDYKCDLIKGTSHIHSSNKPGNSHYPIQHVIS